MRSKKLGNEALKKGFDAEGLHLEWEDL